METIRTGSRLHLSLIDMHGGLGRVDGGIGIALKDPCFEASFEKASQVIVNYQPSHMRVLQQEAQKIAEMICLKLGVRGIKIDIKKTIPRHIGFGSKTQMSLAIAAGICKVYKKDCSVNELAKMVCRGGTSGIGVAAFEQGGLIVDGGHDFSKGFLPSRYSDSPPAPIIFRHDFPWYIVCAWPDVTGAHGAQEKDIFEKNCPISKDDVGEVSRILLMKMLPALIEKDLEEFGAGLNLLQTTGFKKVELGIQFKEVIDLLSFMQKNSPGAGMSSFGPVCFGICESETEAKSLEQEIKSRFSLQTLYTSANNVGSKWL